MWTLQQSFRQGHEASQELDDFMHLSIENMKY